MRHPDQDQLVLYHYGEGADREALARHLESCPRCRAAQGRLRAVLGAVDTYTAPERPQGYGRQVWARLAPRLERERPTGWREWWRPPRLALAASVAALVALAFLVGRYGPGAPDAPIPPQVRERILLVTVGDHLERSQRLLVELVSAAPGEGPTIDLSGTQSRAGALAMRNRLYRQTAARSGAVDVAELLDELERVLLEVANGPAAVSASRLIEIQRRIEARGLLLRIRALEEAGRPAVETPPGGAATSA